MYHSRSFVHALIALLCKLLWCVKGTAGFCSFMVAAPVNAAEMTTFLLILLSPFNDQNSSL
jgi:hypothetical protein